MNDSISITAFRIMQQSIKNTFANLSGNYLSDMERRWRTIPININIQTALSSIYFNNTYS